MGPATLASTLCHLEVVGDAGQPETFPVLVRVGAHQHEMPCYLCILKSLPAHWACKFASGLHMCAQTRTVHRNARTDMVENVAFMYCPPERKVEVPVPIKACHRARLQLPRQCSLGLRHRPGLHRHCAALAEMHAPFAFVLLSLGCRAL